MESADLRYTVDENQVVHEVLDREVVLVNLDSGYYYVVEGTGVDIWQLVAAGATVGEAAEVLLQRFSGSAAEVEQAVHDFVAELVQGGLLTSAGDRVAFERPSPGTSSVAQAKGQAFTLPAMYKYTDMANLIQMDPIRDFDETGWPRRRAAPPKTQP